MSFEGWKKYIFSEFVQINPSVRLESTKEYSFVEMKDLNERSKFVYPSTKRKLLGGAKFENGDTLFARITPCLENGKICQVKGLEGGVGFGSTEFLVFRGKEGVSDSDFVFYLSRYTEVRQFAEQNMLGTSGRQRVTWDAFDNLELELPPLPTQCRIASILSTLDEKIELNRQTNQTLEAIAQAIYKEWFINFNFPTYEGKPYRDSGGEMQDSELGPIPKGWRVKSLYDTASFVNGSAFREIDFSSKHSGLPIIKITELKNGISNQTKFTEKACENKYKIRNGEILFSWSGSPDTSIDTFIWTSGPAWLNQHIFKVIPHFPFEKDFIYHLLRFLKSIFIEIARDKQTTGLGHVTVQDMKRMQVVYPPDSIIHTFQITAAAFLEKVIINSQQSATLAVIRDELLPKLINGEVGVALEEIV